ncbi:MAG: hypothetical protein AB8B63_03745 [Granulosicoccus sp.]
MIWITTLCLLLVAAWFLFNGMNERNWVKAHGHETGDDGEGILYKLAPSRDDEDLIYKVSTKPGMVEKLAADKPVDTSVTGDAFFDRVASRVSETSDRFEDRVAQKVKEVSANSSQSGMSASSNEAAGQTAGATARNLKASLAERAKKMSAGYRANARAAAVDGDQDLMTRVSNKVKSSASIIAAGTRKDS